MKKYEVLPIKLKKNHLVSNHGDKGIEKYVMQGLVGGYAVAVFYTEGLL